MAGLTEFYLSSVWGLRPPAVTRVKAQMDEEMPVRTDRRISDLRLKRS